MWIFFMRKNSAVANVRPLEPVAAVAQSLLAILSSQRAKPGRWRPSDDETRMDAGGFEKTELVFATVLPRMRDRLRGATACPTSACPSPAPASAPSPPMRRCTSGSVTRPKDCCGGAANADATADDKVARLRKMRLGPRETNF